MNVKRIILLLTVISLLGSCRKDDDLVAPPVNEEELITTVILQLVDQVSMDTSEFRFTDLDGDGGTDPIIIGDTLSASSNYAGTVQLLNELEGEDITLEISAEAEEHQFFFDVSAAGLSWNYSDQDANGDPIGILSTWSTTTASSGSILLTLRHGPDKSASGVSSGDITNAGGDTDIEVSLPLVVQ